MPAYNLPIGALVRVARVGDRLPGCMYGAYGVVVGTCKYPTWTRYVDLGGNQCCGCEPVPTAGYTLCMVTGGVDLEHTLRNVSQRIVNLVKPGDLEKDLKSHMKNCHARVQGFDKFKYQLEQLIEREKYAREASFDARMMFP